jgi:hypothetical protein
MQSRRDRDIVKNRNFWKKNKLTRCVTEEFRVFYQERDAKNSKGVFNFIDANFAPKKPLSKEKK